MSSIDYMAYRQMVERTEMALRAGRAKIAQARGEVDPLESLPCEKLAQGLDDPPGQCQRERDLHEDILAECRTRGWIALHGSMAEATHRTEGEWDFVIIADAKIMRCERCGLDYPDDRDCKQSVCCEAALFRCGRVFLVECKTAKGKLTPAQAGMDAWARKLGHSPKVVRSFTEFLEAIK